jgi:hypothetical protein
VTIESEKKGEKEEKETEKERKKGRGEGGTEEVPGSTPGRSCFALLFVARRRLLGWNCSKNVRNDAVSYNGALELKR